MTHCAGYRIRLFLSVDLAGSTAFKTGAGQQSAGSTDSMRQSMPLWVAATRDFYAGFPRLLKESFLKYAPSNHNGESKQPLVWKTIGDEIVFCCRIHDEMHLEACISSFLDTLNEFGRKLDAEGKHLDIKGSGWIAQFPAPNITVSSKAHSYAADQFDEDFENDADVNPREVDFLGPAIDAGFRIAGHSAPDRFVLSAELAWLLSRNDRLGIGELSYHGRHILKGVQKNRPYPIVSVDSERDDIKKEVRENETALLTNGSNKKAKLHKFLTSYMKDEGIEFPFYSLEDLEEREWPESYRNYRQLWLADVEAIRRQAVSEVEVDDGRTENVDKEADVPTNVILNMRGIAEERSPIWSIAVDLTDEGKKKRHRQRRRQPKKRTE